MIKCSKCSKVQPLSAFVAENGVQRKTCADCRNATTAARKIEPRTCAGLPKSWGYGKCAAVVSSTYRCPTCKKIWDEHWDVRHDALGALDFSGGLTGLPITGSKR